MAIILANYKGSKKEFIVDDEDYAWMKDFVWSYGSGGYAFRRVLIDGVNYKYVMMHREILEKNGVNIDGLEVDHINTIRTDNRKENLRPCTQSQNNMNRIAYRNSSSKFKGVYFDKNRNKWVAEIRRDKRKIFLGRFESEEEAALVYDKKAVELFGEFARTNFSTGMQ